MRNLVVCLLMIIACSGCVGGTGLPAVSFAWFNLSTNEIWVTDAVGLPDESWAGRLQPVHGEDRLSEASSTIMETVHIKDQIVIKWKDNGKQGWPGGVNPPGSTPPGAAHEAVFKRSDFGIPAKLSSGKIRFTYLGNDKWRVKFSPNED
jgi:hypothetical protein